MDPPSHSPQPPEAPPEWKGVVGIQNMGNTCYCNTTLQLIRAVPEWTVFCLTHSMAERTKHLPPEDPNRRILLAYQDILSSLWSAHRPAYVRPIGFLNEVRKAVIGTPYEMFAAPVQNDSHEYLVYLLDHFHEAMRTELPYTPVPLPEQATPEQKMRILAHNGWAAYLSKNNSPIVHFFFGMMRKTIQCQTCHTATYQWEVFNTLKIPCEGQTFYEWMEKEANERSEIEGYRCETCKEKRVATLSSHLWHTPSHLFMTLRRFHFNGQKNMTPCPYQGSTLSLQPFFAPESDHESKNYQYEIRGVSDHHGTHMGGHYTAQFKHPLTGQWWIIDDERTYPRPGPEFTASNYIFYFRRVASPSPTLAPID
jgi:ubiquitin C-terminal hydrolase